MVTMEWPTAASFLLLAVTVAMAGSVPLIKAPWGTLQGVSLEGNGGRKMNAYLAIPYALPPVGDLRFEKPVPHPGPGEGVTFIADQLAPACPQIPALIGASRKTSEDCLLLDLYVPEDGDKDGSLAVMIFIHGGGFTVGDAHTYRPSKLVVDGRVIVVAIQYRLGAFGFLYTGDDVIPGNMGLWDQTLAIRWVKDNIQAFGGDPNCITIFGESAGSMSVSLQMLSPQSRGLFQRGIMQSGAAGALSFMSDMFDKKAIFKGLADMFECQGETSREWVKCLKEQTEEDYFNKSSQYSAASPIGGYFFPVIDGEFIPQSALKLLEDEQYMKDNGINDIDVIIGMNNKEGAIALFMTATMNVTMEMMHSFSIFENLLDSCLFLRNLNKNSIVKKTLEFYYRGSEFGANVSETLDAMVDFYGDCVLNVDILDWAQQLASSSHSAGRYLYVFDHDFAFNNNGPAPGSHHGDELILEFDITIDLADEHIFKLMNKTEMAPEEQPLSDKYIQILTSFAKTGNPNPPLKDDLGGDWPQFTNEDQAYLSITQTPKVVTKLGPYKDRLALWTKLLPQLSDLASKLPPEETAEGQPAAEESNQENAAKEEL